MLDLRGIANELSLAQSVTAEQGPGCPAVRVLRFICAQGAGGPLPVPDEGFKPPTNGLKKCPLGWKNQTFHRLDQKLKFGRGGFLKQAIYGEKFRRRFSQSQRGRVITR
jgi:hypothetical protein